MAPHSPYTKTAAISFSNTGDNTIITGISGIRINIYAIVFTTDAATNVTFKDSVGGAFTGAIIMTGNGSSLTLPMSDEPWFTGAAGGNFVINQSGTANIGGIVWYTT